VLDCDVQKDILFLKRIEIEKEREGEKKRGGRGREDRKIN
jgi:hypothetical protein